MNTRLACAIGLILSLPWELWCQNVTGPTVRFHTNLGDIDVTLLTTVAPRTVANFLSYVNRGLFNNSIFHRSVPGFVIQGGGYQWQNGLVEIQQDAAVRNEFSTSNTRGTLAMAKLGGMPNSATNQWFFNEGDNSRNLNNTNGGYTVFGRIANAEGLDVMDKIANVPVVALPSPFDQIPLIDYRGGNPTLANLVVVTSITQVDTTPTPVIDPNGVISASSFGGFQSAAAGSFIEIYGTNLAGSSRAWADSDFVSGTAPNSLDEVRVTVNGQPAYVNFISANQVNVQVPSGLPTSGTVPVVVSNKGVSSAPVQLAMKAVSGGLLAPSSFLVGGKQYVAAVHAGTVNFVSNGGIPGLPAAPAKAGETLVFYGAGFGAVNPSSVPVAGQIVQGQTTLQTPVQFKFGASAGQVIYAGFSPGLIGVYQFNVTLPADLPSGDVALTVVVGDEPIAQTLYLSVQN